MFLLDTYHSYVASCLLHLHSDMRLLARWNDVTLTPPMHAFMNLLGIFVSRNIANDTLLGNIFPEGNAGCAGFENKICAKA